MLLLTTTNHKLEVSTSTAANVEYTVAFVDHTSTTVLPGSNQGAIAAATVTTICAAPGASTYRQVKDISIRNVHGATANSIVVSLDVSGTDYRSTPAINLEAGESIYWTEGIGWAIYLASGLPKTTTAVDSVAWGDITGTLSNQADLYNELNSLFQIGVAL